jgi:hypothetical protein
MIGYLWVGLLFGTVRIGARLPVYSSLLGSWAIVAVLPGRSRRPRESLIILRIGKDRVVTYSLTPYK